ncbi:ParB domain protein nuclease [Sulfobacillus acidophilus DSM 10332]|uniref:ParB domain protein nuclease n=1 Tax=Sulfobacillus acidophilus (strain ATCC 700253 / DSM 10332 / NAL) TaxID=679936 RepID=G8TV65_SULAD|nr:ParB domain protein nuclease [Sulfobacillus acidophilus DSM 10332]
MPSFLDPHKLRPHPANAIFDPLPDDVYAALKDDIEHRGMLNPILITPDYIVIAGHHRLQAALDLGLETVPVEIHDVDPDEAEDRLIADNVLRRQLNPMEQARLIQRLKARYGIKKGNNQRVSGSVKFTDALQAVGLKPETAYQLDRLNKLIPPLQDLISAGKLRTSHGVALAALTPEQQTALYDAIGESVTQLKLADIQAAKKGPDTSAVEARIAALEAERDALQQQLTEIQATVHDNAEANALVESLQRQLADAEAARQATVEEVTRLKAQTPVERLVEKVVTVEKPVPDPMQAHRIMELEQALADLQQRWQQVQQERKAADQAGKDLRALEREIQRLEQHKAAIEIELQNLTYAQNRFSDMLNKQARISGTVTAIQENVVALWPKLQAYLDAVEGHIAAEPARRLKTLVEQLETMVEGIKTRVFTITVNQGTVPEWVVAELPINTRDVFDPSTDKES